MRKKDTTPYIPLIGFLSKFTEVTSDIEADIYKNFRLKEYPKGTILVDAKSVCNALYFIVQGCARNYHYIQKKEVTNWLSFEYSMVTGFASYITREPGVEYVELLSDALVLQVEYKDMQKLFEKSHKWERIGRIITEYYFTLLDKRVVSVQLLSAREKYENLLNEEPAAVKRVPLKHVASYLGITQETLSRIRSSV